MNNFEKKLYDLALPIVLKSGFLLDSVEDAHENGMQILRFLIDSENDKGIDIEEVTSINELISAMLDEIDPIDGEYYLEVSSVGLEKELKTKDQIKASINKYINVKTYEKILINKNEKSGLKEFFGNLIFADEEKIIIEAVIKQFKKEITINYSQIAKIRLAIKF